MQWSSSDELLAQLVELASVTNRLLHVGLRFEEPHPPIAKIPRPFADEEEPKKTTAEDMKSFFDR